MAKFNLSRLWLAGLCASAMLSPAFAADKKIVLIAGRPSHPPGMHEFRAGTLLLKSCLDTLPGITTVVASNGWPESDRVLDGAAAVVIYADGGAGNPAIQGGHRSVLNSLARRGVGLGFMHYGVEIPSTNGGAQFLEWIGGYYEHLFSVNPMWSPEYNQFSNHPICRGVKPFSTYDEWYFNIRWPSQPAGQLTPILVATPPDKVRDGPYVYPQGPYPHIQAAKGHPEALMWAFERSSGGRGFGFTGGHTHANWGNENQRKVVLNALLWIANIEVPADGVQSTVTSEQLRQNLDPKGKPPAAAAATATAAKPATHPNGPEAALADTARLQTAEGLQATLFASEPMVVNPCDFDVDAQGRVWVCEGANYRSSFQKWGIQRPDGDRIVVLDDTDHDGRADKQTVFYQDNSVNAALGICVLGNKVIVSVSPNVFLLTDTDGDGKADQRDLLFTDIKGFDHDHAVHAFVFGPDGKLYFNYGNAGEQLKRPRAADRHLPLHGPVAKEVMANAEPVVDLAGNIVKTGGKPYRQGMVFRCNLDGSALETLGHNFRNNYEVCVDSFGTMWQSDNDDDGNRGVRINYVMEYGNYGYTDEMTGASWGTGWKKAKAKGASEDERGSYHWYQQDPGVVPNLLQTGNGSPTGICIYEGKLLPPVFRNQMLHCDAGPRVVRAYPVENSGAGYKATLEDLLTSPDSWYRPSDVCVGPDGSVYVADWHDAGVGGHNMADRELATMTGRIYRVAPPGHRPAVTRFDYTSPRDATAALLSPNQATRYLAWSALHEMQAKAESDLLEIWKGNEPRMRARALQLLARIKGRETKYINAGLADHDSDIRITALRIARSLQLEVIPYVKRLAKDSSPQVRRECAIALRHSKSSEAPHLWATLAQQHDGHDRWYLEALGIGMDQQEDRCFDAWLAAVGDRWNTPAGRDIVWRSRAKKAPALLAKLVMDKQTTAKDKDRYLRALDFIQGPEKDAALLEIATGGLN